MRPLSERGLSQVDLLNASKHRDRPQYVPASTYRLQVYHAFPLTAARDVVPYLARLGVEASACVVIRFILVSSPRTSARSSLAHPSISR